MDEKNSKQATTIYYCTRTSSTSFITKSPYTHKAIISSVGIISVKVYAGIHVGDSLTEIL